MNHWETTPPVDRQTEARSITRDLELLPEHGQPNEFRTLRILEQLKKQELLDEAVDRVKGLYEAEMREMKDDFGEDCWELLAVLELFDPETAQHCISTYEVARKKVKKVLWNGVVLAETFQQEQVDLTQFYRTCLLHDIGKIEVPHAVLVNRVPDEHCADILFDHRDDILVPRLKEKFGENFVLPESIHDGPALLQYLYTSLHIRPQEITPIKLLLEHPLDDEIKEQLAHCGCSPDDTLLHIMRTHDAYSERILTALGYPIEGEIAGAHHHHPNGDKKYQITIGTMRVSIDLADIIHLADVENAMLSKRHYKEGGTPLKALQVLALHTKQGLIQDYIAYLWIADELLELHPEKLGGDEQKLYTDIATFLDTERSQHLGWPDWNAGHKSWKKAA
ncbi:MAG: hypothetical protein WBO92_03415 [Candidatus Moraniibacteriota bacterium]